MAQFNGIDVSKYQGNIDWAKVKQSGIEFAMIRVGSSTNIDVNFVNNIKGASAQGIKCGCYLYSYATNVSQANDEADFVIKTIKPYNIIYPVAFDIEDSVQSNLTKAQITDIIVAFCSKIKAAGYIPAIYSSLSWFNTKFDLSRIATYDKWIAAWRSTPPTFEGGYAIWQNSDSGNVLGISGSVDTDISYKDYGSQVNTQTSSTTPTTTPTTTKKYTAGTKLTLKNVTLYSSATSNIKQGVLNGSYWIYDGVVINNRLRITNSANKVNKQPLAQNVTGFVNVTNL